MSTLTKEIATILSENDFGIIGDDIFVSEDVPPKPDAMVIIRNTGTSTVDGPNVLLDLSSPTIQIVVRGGRGEGQACEDKAFSIKNFLEKLASYISENSRYVYINHLSGPVDIGLDETMRPRYSTNFYALRTPVVRLASSIGVETSARGDIDVNPAEYVEGSCKQLNYCAAVLVDGTPLDGNVGQQSSADPLLSEVNSVKCGIVQATLVQANTSRKGHLVARARQVLYSGDCPIEVHDVVTITEDELVYSQEVEVSLSTTFRACEDWPPLLISHLKDVLGQTTSNVSVLTQTVGVPTECIQVTLGAAVLDINNNLRIEKRQESSVEVNLRAIRKLELKGWHRNSQRNSTMASLTITL